MAPPYTFGDITNLGTDQYSYSTYLDLAGQELQAAYFTGDWLTGKSNVSNAGGYLRNAASVYGLVAASNIRHDLYNLFVSIWLYWPSGGGGSITMDDILSAMVQADFAQLTYFIGLVDAYRSAVWDQPFNSEFYAALARGFRP